MSSTPKAATARDLIWVGPLALFVAVGTFFASGGRFGLEPGERIGIPLAALAALTLLHHRRSATQTVLAVGLLVGLFFGLGLADGPIYLPLLFAAYLVGRAEPVRDWLPWVAGALALVLVGMAVRAATTDIGWWQPLGQGVGTSALVVAAASIGSLVRSRAQTEAERAARAATEEQLRMARDLHDGVGHGLAVIAMQAGVGLHVLDRDPAAARSALEAIREASRESLEALRAELSRLAGTAPRTARHGLDDLDVLVARVAAAGPRVDLRAGAPGELPDDVGAAAYAIVQEALTNVLRHSEARTVEVVLDGGDPLVVRVTDDGRGGVVSDEGLGLRGMRQRAEALGGTLSAGPAAAGGFEVVASIPTGAGR